MSKSTSSTNENEQIVQKQEHGTICVLHELVPERIYTLRSCHLAQRNQTTPLRLQQSNTVTPKTLSRQTTRPEFKRRRMASSNQTHNNSAICSPQSSDQVGHVHRHLINLRAVVLLNVSQDTDVVLAHKVDRHTLAPKTPRATNAMDVELTIIW